MTATHVVTHTAHFCLQIGSLLLLLFTFTFSFSFPLLALASLLSAVLAEPLTDGREHGLRHPAGDVDILDRLIGTWVRPYSLAPSNALGKQGDY